MQGDKNIIFFGGIHGSGKGTICAKISKIFNLIHITASDVLKWSEISSSLNKIVNDFDTTQSRLINGLKELVEIDKEYLLDGHYCLLNNKGEPEKINEKIFHIINPKALVVVIENIDVIYNRLKDRDGEEYDVHALGKMQRTEVEYCEYLSKNLKVPLIKVINKDDNELINYLTYETSIKC